MNDIQLLNDVRAEQDRLRRQDRTLARSYAEVNGVVEVARSGENSSQFGRRIRAERQSIFTPSLSKVAVA